MRDAFHLAWRYLRAHPVRSLVLALGTAVALFLPTFTWLASERIEDGLLRRADATPILIGAMGNEFDLTMSSLYFRGQVSTPIRWGERHRVEEAGYGIAVPLDVRFTAGGAPIVGTGLEYFEARSLALASGRWPALLGEVVAGAEVARELDLEVGDTVRSDLTNLYNLAGAYPILLDVVGILEPASSPDDEAFFADVKTTWVIDGRLHGHDEVTPEMALPGSGDVEPTEEEVETRGEENLEATAAIFLFNRITAANRDSFHLHGSMDEGPITGLLVFPKDTRAHDQLLGDYALLEDRQAIRPVEVLETVLGIVLRARRALEAYFGVVALSTLAFFVLVLLLSLRLRERELRLMRRIGSGRHVIATMVFAEIALVVAAALMFALVASGGALWLLEQRLPGT